MKLLSQFQFTRFFFLLRPGDLILKIVNRDSVGVSTKINLAGMGELNANAIVTVLSGDPDAENSCDGSNNIQPQTSNMTVNKSFTYQAPASSLTVIRIYARSMGKK